MPISILPVARAMIAHYEDRLTAERVVHDLVKAGTARHSIAIYPADGQGVDTNRYDFNQPEKVHGTFYKEEESPYGYLVVAWVWKSRRDRAAEIMQSYENKGFRDTRSWWFGGRTKIDLVAQNKLDV